jgi:UDP-glucuronate decarboxylase
MSILYKEARAWLEKDWCAVQAALGEKTDFFRGKRVLVTGAAGFLGFNFLHFFSHLNETRFGANPVTVVASDNYRLGQPRWIRELAATDSNIALKKIDITELWPEEEESAFDFIIHGASIASPSFYRKYPLETLDSNVGGLRNMLELSRRQRSQGLLFFSSSEIYGDPPTHHIPTKETYRGNVACIGPRACYDESKRLGETLCYLYAQQHRVPAKIVRPFNNYGPGLRLADGRVLSDLCRNALEHQDIVLYSDGKATRTFCYSSDALTGYLLVLLNADPAEPFNIGSDSPEISMEDVAGLVSALSGSAGRIVRQQNEDVNYTTDSPKRRCPDIARARSLLGFTPNMPLEEGIQRLLGWYRQFVALEELIIHQ